MKKLFLILVVSFSTFSLQAQNLDLIGQDQPFRVNGGMSLSQVGYWSNDSISRRDPYNYYLAGNLNFSLYGWSVPFTFTYSNQQVNFTQPFNQYSMHPTYKWIKLHVGYTSMSFSPYTLNGHLFLGGGVELTPEGPFTFSAMYGRLRRTIEYDTTSANPSLPEFERWGYGLKGSYKLPEMENMTARITLSMFHAADKEGTISYIPDSLIAPGENLVLGSNLDLTIAQRITINGEIASSAVTHNTQSLFDETEKVKWNRMLGTMIGSNATTEYYTATRFNVNYVAEIYTLGVGYERIDPGYQTYGAYYFNSDMENITLNGTLRLFENKVNLAANVGKQRDNLNDAKASEMKRWVTAFNAGYNSGDKLSASVSYSTFTSFMNIRSDFDYINQTGPLDNFDTLDYTQLSASTNANVSYILKNTDQSRQNLSLNFSHQTASDRQGSGETESGSKFYNLSGAYGYAIVPVSLTITAAMNANFNRGTDMETTTFGPTVALSKLFFEKKLRNSISASYNRALTNGLVQTRVLSIRGNSSYRLGKRHNFNLGLTFMNRKTQMQEDPRKLSEFIATLGYSMSF